MTRCAALRDGSWILELYYCCAVLCCAVLCCAVLCCLPCALALHAEPLRACMIIQHDTDSVIVHDLSAIPSCYMTVLHMLTVHVIASHRSVPYQPLHICTIYSRPEQTQSVTTCRQASRHCRACQQPISSLQPHPGLTLSPTYPAPPVHPTCGGAPCLHHRA